MIQIHITKACAHLCSPPELLTAGMAKAVNPYGDGHACARIADAILWHFGRRSERPADFNA